MYNLKSTINVTQLKTRPENLTGLKEDEVLQLVQKDSGVMKVVITQEYFLSLLNEVTQARLKLEEEEPKRSSMIKVGEVMEGVRARARTRQVLRKED